MKRKSAWFIRPRYPRNQERSERKKSNIKNQKLQKKKEKTITKIRDEKKKSNTMKGFKM